MRSSPVNTVATMLGNLHGIAVAKAYRGKRAILGVDELGVASRHPPWALYPVPLVGS